jgi:hypothetical protein
VPDEATCGAEHCPAATAGRAAVVEAIPGELSASSAIARPVAHVKVGFNSQKHEFAVVFTRKSDVSGPEEIEILPLRLTSSTAC